MTEETWSNVIKLPVHGRQTQLKTMTAFSQLMERWEIAPDDGVVLIELSEASGTSSLEFLEHPMAREARRRLSIFEMIHATYEQMPDPQAFDGGWLNAPNPDFGDFAPIDMLLDDGWEGVFALYTWLSQQAIEQTRIRLIETWA